SCLFQTGLRGPVPNSFGFKLIDEDLFHILDFRPPKLVPGLIAELVRIQQVFSTVTKHIRVWIGVSPENGLAPRPSEFAADIEGSPIRWRKRSNRDSARRAVV